jgi:hypothetical protein
MFDAADATHKAQHFVRGDRHDNPASHFRFSAGWSVATNTNVAASVPWRRIRTYDSNIPTWIARSSEGGDYGERCRFKDKAGKSKATLFEGKNYQNQRKTP